MGHVFITPLNWGLGHASRDVPVIRELLHQGHEVTVGAWGNARALLEREFPSCNFIDFPDYPVSAKQGRFFFPRFMFHMPSLVEALSNERKNLDTILSSHHFDLIISDSRPGVYSKTVPSLHITHQTHQSFPLIVWPIELVALYVNARGFRKYTSLIIPDNPPGPISMAGKLSKTFFPGTKRQAYYSGILASLSKVDTPKTIDFLFSISGMEPQRTVLEKILLPQIGDLPGKKVVLLGKPSQQQIVDLDDGTTCYSYVPYAEKARLMSSARCIISRSGYTSMMDLAELECKSGLFIPTPGQWEQEYLSSYYQRKKWFMSISQYRLRIVRDLAHSAGYTGFPDMPKTSENVRRMYEQLLSRYLE
jgi:hypothetical protein